MGRCPPGGEPYTQQGLPPPLSKLIAARSTLLGQKPHASLGIARDALENSSCVHRCAYSRFGLPFLNNGLAEIQYILYIAPTEELDSGFSVDEQS